METEFEGDVLIQINIIEQLMKDNCFESVEIYSNILFTHPKLSYDKKCEFGLYLGICFFKKGEFKHSLYYLNNSFMITDAHNIDDKKAKHNAEVIYYKVQNIYQLEENKNNFEMLMKCIRNLEEIPLQYRLYKHNYLLSTYYIRTYHPEKAKEYCLTALRQQPYSLECLSQLSSLGIDPKEVYKIYASLNIDISKSPLLNKLIPAIIQENTNSSYSLTLYKDLLSIYPSNAYIVSCISKMYLYICLYKQAYLWYQRALKLDRYLLRNMCVYIECVQILKNKEAIKTIKDVAEDIEQISRANFMLYLSLFYYYYPIDKVQAMNYLSLCSDISPAHLSIYKGREMIAIEEGNKDLYKQLCWDMIKLYPNLYSYKCLVDAHLMTGDIQEALYISKSLYDSRYIYKGEKDHQEEIAECIYILGRTLSKCKNGRDQARKQLEKCLVINSHNEEAIMTLVNIYIEDKQIEKARDLLLNILPCHPSTALKNILIRILINQKDIENALYQLQTSLTEINENDENQQDKNINTSDDDLFT
ncbi:hypothetical protein WA158_004325 [Blastocystis sp. Blastoise]